MTARRRSFTPDEKARMRELRDTGSSWESIALEFGATRRAVQSAIDPIVKAQRAEYDRRRYDGMKPSQPRRVGHQYPWEGP